MICRQAESYSLVGPSLTLVRRSRRNVQTQDSLKTLTLTDNIRLLIQRFITQTRVDDDSLVTPKAAVKEAKCGVAEAEELIYKLEVLLVSSIAF